MLKARKLTDIYYGGTQADWNKISINTAGNTDLLNATIHYGSTYTVTYDANGGTGTPSSQTKTENTTLTLSRTKPTKSYVLQYNAAGGSVTPSTKTVSCTFKNWNTSKNGSGTAYAPGASYTANADATGRLGGRYTMVLLVRMCCSPSTQNSTSPPRSQGWKGSEP